MSALGRCGSKLLGGIVVLTLSACGSGGNVPSGPAELVGTWEWAGTSGGIGGESRVPGPDDPRITVQFRAEGTAVFRRNGEVSREQRYRLSDEVTILGPAELPVLYFDDEELGRVVGFDESGQTLTLSDNVHDGFSLEYRRVID